MIITLSQRDQMILTHIHPRNTGLSVPLCRLFLWCYSLDLLVSAQMPHYGSILIWKEREEAKKAFKLHDPI